MKTNFFLQSSLLLLFYLYACHNSNTVTKAQNEDHPVPEVKSIFINGDSIHYIDIGKGEPIVFVHGTLGDYRTWGAQIDTFSRNHRVIAYSRRFAYPNKQMTNDSADYTVFPHAKDLAEFMKALNLTQVHLVGHSYGAFTALLTTIDHPELVRSLTLGEPPVMSLLQNVSGSDTMLKNLVKSVIIPTSNAFNNNENEKAAATFLNGVTGDSLFFLKIPQQGRSIMLDNLLELRGIVFNKRPDPPITCNELKKIKTPVLLLMGDRSPLFLNSIIGELDHCLEIKERVTLSNSSHGLELENPLAFNKIVLDFIHRHE